MKNISEFKNLKEILKKDCDFALDSIKKECRITSNEELVLSSVELVRKEVENISGHAKYKDYIYLVNALHLIESTYQNTIMKKDPIIKFQLEQLIEIIELKMRNNKNIKNQYYSKDTLNLFKRLIKLSEDIIVNNNFSEEVIDRSDLEVLNMLIYKEKDIELVKDYLKQFPDVLKKEDNNNNFFYNQLINEYLLSLEKDDNQCHYYGAILKHLLKYKYVKITKEYKSKLTNKLKEYSASIKTNIKGNQRRKHAKFLLEDLINQINNNLDNKLEAINNLAYKYNLNEFSSIVIPKFEKIDQINGYKDYTDLYTITIDSSNANSYDDALALEYLPNGNKIVYLFTSDVDHFVKKDSNIDLLAKNQIKVVYNDVKTYTLFPKLLHDGILSLNKNQVKPTICIKVEFDTQNEIVDYKFEKTIVKVNKNYSYSDVYEKVHRKAEGYVAFLEQDKLISLSNIATSLMLKDSSVDKYHRFKEQNYKKKITEKEVLGDDIVSTFKILANSLIAKEMTEAKLPFIFRNQTGLSKEFLETIKTMNINNHSLTEINNILTKDYRKSYYSTENDGHFALNKDAYAHATTPIRNYLALENLRVLKLFIEENRNDNLYYKLEEEFKDTAAYANVKIANLELFKEESKTIQKTKKNKRDEKRTNY